MYINLSSIVLSLKIPKYNPLTSRPRLFMSLDTYGYCLPCLHCALCTKYNYIFRRSVIRENKRSIPNFNTTNKR